MYYVKVLDGLLFVSHWKGNFSFNGVFSGASPPKLSFHIQSVKVVDLNGRGGGRGANTFNIHIRMETPRRSNFADYFSFSLDRRFHSKLSSPRVSTSPKYENVSGGHKGIFSDKGIAMPRLVFWQKISIWRIWRGLVLCSLYFDNHIKYLFDEYGMGWYCAHYE